jgi:ribonuclease Z
VLKPLLDPSVQIRLDIYGPPGLRTFVRSNLALTHVELAGRYAVHELLTQEDKITSCTSSERHPNENEGWDLFADDNMLYPSVHEDDRMRVAAARIVHRGDYIDDIFAIPLA